MTSKGKNKKTRQGKGWRRGGAESACGLGSISVARGWVQDGEKEGMGIGLAEPGEMGWV